MPPARDRHGSAFRLALPIWLCLGGCAKDSVAPGPGVAGPDAGAPDVMVAQEAGGPSDDAADVGGAELAASDVAPAGCDLSGRWLVASRVLATALGQEQAAHNWFYYELEQSGADVVVKKGLHCGFEVVKKTGFAASVDSQGAWPAFLMRNTSAGRKGQAVAGAAGCAVSFAREYVVRGATIPHYMDPAVPLPDRTQKAEGATPGWEDWDGDGNPGVSYNVSSALSGTVYVCQRDWTEYAGDVAASAVKFKLTVRYGTEQKSLGRSPGSSELIETSGQPASDASQHRVWFHRLGDGQAAAGGDAEICAAVRGLRNQLVPEAND